MLMIAMGMICGCSDRNPPPPQVPVPPPVGTEPPGAREVEPAKPLPAPTVPTAAPAPVEQGIPEAGAFVELWTRMGRPRIAVVVDAPQEGKLSPADGAATSTASPRDVSAMYLDPAGDGKNVVKAMDFRMLESDLSEWIRCGGQVTVVNAEAASQADIIIRAQVRPPDVSPKGATTVVLCETSNVSGAEILTQTSADVSLPISKTQTRDLARFLAKRSMDGMMSAWMKRGLPPSQTPATLPAR